MAEQYVSPWTTAVTGKPGPCHYGCGKPATMTEPGTPWKAHKVCAEGDTGGTPLGSWDDSDRKLVADRPLGCGPYPPGATSGRFCDGSGTQLACQLCPRSPSYCNPEDPIPFVGTVTDQPFGDLV